AAEDCRSPRRERNVRLVLRARFWSAAALRAFSSTIAALPAQMLVRIFSAHGESDSAARRELRVHNCLARRACLDEIVENAIRDRFIERALVSIRGKVKFERLAFDTEPVRYVIDLDPGKIGLTRYRANGSEIIRFEVNPVISAGWIRKSLKSRFCRMCGQFRLTASKKCEITRFFRAPHNPINADQPAASNRARDRHHYRSITTTIASRTRMDSARPSRTINSHLFLLNTEPRTLNVQRRIP